MNDASENGGKPVELMVLEECQVVGLQKRFIDAEVDHGCDVSGEHLIIGIDILQRIDEIILIKNHNKK